MCSTRRDIRQEVSASFFTWMRDPCHLFVGDTLFAGSVGRTDIPMSGGDPETLERSIRTVLWPLDDDTVVHPGHGPLTTIGHERRTNPFVGEHATGLGRGRYH